MIKGPRGDRLLVWAKIGTGPSIKIRLHGHDGPYMEGSLVRFKRVDGTNLKFKDWQSGVIRGYDQPANLFRVDLL